MSRIKAGKIKPSRNKSSHKSKLTGLDQRSAGILMHITSLPGSCYIGDMGRQAKAFCEFLAEAGQTWWQMLPVNPIGAGNSPYSTISTFAGEPLLIDLYNLMERGLLNKRDLPSPKAPSHPNVQFSRASKFKGDLLKKAYQQAMEQDFFNDLDFQNFCKKERHWLDDYSLFVALAQKFKTKDWSKWPKEFRHRDETALRKARSEYARAVQYQQFLQFCFHKQWQDLKQVAQRYGVSLLGDLPIFVAYESADVWAHPELFLLNDKLKPSFVAGVPPDSFNPDGQLWGNALYQWPAHREQNFEWWMQRLTRILALFDAVRLDHFIGFNRFWRIPTTAKSAKSGSWVSAPGDELFSKVTKIFCPNKFIAEDLGAVTLEVRSLRDDFGFPGMKVLQFAFEGTEESLNHQPQNFSKNSIVYTGTHDNHTALGWLASLKKQVGEKNSSAYQLALAYFGSQDFVWSMIRCAYQSPANTAMIPMQDVLQLGPKFRMNTPGIAKGNWRWRMEYRQLTSTLTKQLRQLAEASGRIPPSRMKVR